MTQIPTAADYHIPVMMDEVLAGLQVEAGKWYVDGTVGGGGHTEQILRAGGNVLGIDQDEDALASVRQRLPEAIESGRLRLAKANFSDLVEVCRREGLDNVQGILLDLGVSSYQLNELERGFRFDSDHLDMRMDRSLPITAADLIARLSERDLSQLFSDLGEERYARHFAKVIVTDREDEPITSSRQLAELIYRVSPPPYRRGPIHPATRVFQALRLAVNAEMDSLKRVLPQTAEVLSVGGRLVVISFHSLEDRQVKHFLQEREDFEIVTKRPLVPAEDEVKLNPRSRSAKLRVGQKQ